MSGEDDRAAPQVPDDVPDVVVVEGHAQSYRGNVHEELKVVLVLDSGLTVRRRGTTFRVAPGQLVALHADDAHSGGPDVGDDPARWLIMCVAPSLIAKVAAPDAVRFGDPVIRDDGGLADRFRVVHGSLYEPAGRPGAALTRETGVLDFVAALARHAPDAAGGDEATGAARRAPETVREYLRAHLTRNVTLDELSAVAGVSKYRLVRVCTAWFGLPPHKLHLRLRLDRARELLRRGSAIAEAAYATGFHDQSHLTRVFASAYGMTPAVYQGTFNGRAWAGRALG
jgi:AraC-like DNA-binding protein